MYLKNFLVSRISNLASFIISPTLGKPFYFLLCCDTDPDRPDFGGTYLDQGRSPQIWKGVETIPHLREKLSTHVDSKGRTLPFTWLLRCDENIKQCHGDPAYLINHYREIWLKCESFGDEIGWHPHFFRYNEEQKRWYQELDDHSYIDKLLEDGFQYFEQAWKKPPRSVRTGWTYHTSRSMKKLADLNISIDLSALPSQKFSGAYDDRGAIFAGAYDWSNTPRTAYYPTENNYQSADGEALSILELPCSVLESKLASFLSDLRSAVREKSLKKVYSSFTQPSVKITTIKGCAPNFLFSSMLKQLLQNEDFGCITYFHPDEWISDKGQFINNLIHKFSNMDKNMKSLIKLCQEYDRELIGITASEAYEIFK